MPTIYSEFDPANKFRVPLKQWNRWNGLARSVFNKTMETTLKSVEAIAPPGLRDPKGYYISEEDWKVLCWNHAWISADIASRGSKHIYGDTHASRKRVSPQR